MIQRAKTMAAPTIVSEVSMTSHTLSISSTIRAHDHNPNQTTRTKSDAE